jgi:hypothetical protein
MSITIERARVGVENYRTTFPGAKRLGFVVVDRADELPEELVGGGDDPGSFLGRYVDRQLTANGQKLDGYMVIVAGNHADEAELAATLYHLGGYYELSRLHPNDRQNLMDVLAGAQHQRDLRPSWRAATTILGIKPPPERVFAVACEDPEASRRMTEEEVERARRRFLAVCSERTEPMTLDDLRAFTRLCAHLSLRNPAPAHKSLPDIEHQLISLDNLARSRGGIAVSPVPRAPVFVKPLRQIREERAFELQSARDQAFDKFWASPGTELLALRSEILCEANRRGMQGSVLEQRVFEGAEPMFQERIQAALAASSLAARHAELYRNAEKELQRYAGRVPRGTAPAPVPDGSPYTPGW